MSSFTDNRYSINGLIKTDTTVMQNLEKLCNAAGCWLTYDIYTGLWSVVINRAGVSEWSFDDNNIIGGISLSGTGLDNLYNSVKVTYPHEDLRGNTDFIQIEIPTEDRYPNEPDNTLQIQYEIVTNPVQAELLGFIELKQSRVDRIIQFTTDYSKMAVRAGDVIDVTNTIYGFSAKLFRVVSVNEVESPDGGIDISITALEYDANVYSEDLTRYVRTTENGILAIGAIPAPDAPTITKYEQDVRPRVEVSTQITGGIVERIEFWYTTDTTEPNDASRNYQLLAIQAPKNSASFTTSETITAETDGLNSGDFYVKARAVNSQATSPFSDPSALIEYIPVQTTQNIDDGTNMTGLAGTLALTSLLNLLAGSFTGNTSNNSLYNSVFGNYANNTGFNLRTNASSLSNVAAKSDSSVYRIQYNVGAGNAVLTIPDELSNSFTTGSFTVPIGGVYKLDILYHNATETGGAPQTVGDGGRGITRGETDNVLYVIAEIRQSSDNSVVTKAQTTFGGLYGHGGALTTSATLSTGVGYYLYVYIEGYFGGSGDTASYAVGYNIYYRGA